MKVNSPLLISIVLLTLLYFGLSFLLGLKRDPKEPPFIPQKIPFVGHLVSLARHGTRYYNQLSMRYPLPIYSLEILGGRMYIVNSPDLVAAVQRNARTLMSGPFSVKFAAQVFDVSKETKAIWMDNVDGKRGDWGLHFEGMKGMHDAMAHGKAELDQMNQVMLENMVLSLEKFKTPKDTVNVPLMEWLRHEITGATTNALYGPLNPFKDAAVERGFWNFHDNFTMLLINVMPYLTAKKGFQGRERVFQGFNEYLKKGGPDHQSSGLFRARYAANMKYNVSIRDIARFEIGDVLAAITNVTPTSFWCLYHIYSDSNLLRQLRAELVAASSISLNEEGSQIHLVDVSALRVKCPLLISTFQEVLRIRSMNASVRVVTKDTLLDNQYLLKKDAVIHMPSNVIHSDSSVWGPTARDFEAHRFIKPEKKINSGSFRGFGGGTTLCPGRHFATTVIVSIVAMFVLRYDLEPMSGKWLEPTTTINNLVAAVLPPDQDIKVNVVARDESSHGSWKFVSIESKSRLALSVVE